MDRISLAKRLIEINIWWDNHEVPKSIKRAETHRRLFYVVNKILDDERILAITGPRQVGKTTMMGQLIEYQIKEKNIPPERIMYLPIDNELIKLYSSPEDILTSCLDVYSSSIVGKKIRDLKNNIYIYLDEIQDLEKWDKIIKNLYDTYENLRFIITGSSHSLLQKGFSESLVGRINIKTLLPLKFSEFLSFKEKNKGEDEETKFNKKYGIWNLNSSFRASVKNNNPEQLMRTIANLDSRIYSSKQHLTNLLDEYLIKGGFPHSVNSTTTSEAGQLLKQDLELTIYKDIHRLFKTRDPSKMMSLLTYISEHTTAPISMNSLAKKAGTSWSIVDQFLNHFEQIFLINKLTYCSEENGTTKSSMIRLKDTGILNTLLSQMDEKSLMSDNYRIVSTAVAGHAVHLMFKISQFTEKEIQYWSEDGHSDRTIEAIITKPAKLPIGVAYDERMLTEKIKAVTSFLRKNRLKYGIIITKEKIGVENNILFFPLVYFLLMC